MFLAWPLILPQGVGDRCLKLCPLGNFPSLLSSETPRTMARMQLPCIFSSFP